MGFGSSCLKSFQILLLVLFNSSHIFFLEKKFPLEIYTAYWEGRFIELESPSAERHNSKCYTGDFFVIMMLL